MNHILVPQNWDQYFLIDSGDHLKLESWAGYVVSRPEPRAIWNKNSSKEWSKADAWFDGKEWNFRSPPPEPWKLSYSLTESKKIVFSLRTTDFKHTGVFPEQGPNWEWIFENFSGLKVLNLFAYTGGSTLAAAHAGAIVTHVDASRPAMMWASENAKLSSVPKDRIRWIQDDVMKFVFREQRRGEKYDAIIMDPPKFGRGTGGEVWKLEEDLPRLVEETKKILTDRPKFYLLNAYTADLSHIAIRQLLGGRFAEFGGAVESGELGIEEKSGNRIMPAGIWARWLKNDSNQ